MGPDVDFTPSNPHQGAWLVYVNGLEIPCPSVQVSYGVGQIPEAQLTFPPHRLLHRLGAEDRLDVVIFYLDTLINPGKPSFRLLFEGEIMGWRYRNTASGRSISFNATANISVWTQLYFYFLNTVDAVMGAATGKGFDATTFVQPGVFYPFSLFKKGLVFRPDQAKADIRNPYDILYNAVMGMMASSVPEEAYSIPAINFFGRWARKNNFHQRFHALPIFEDVGDANAGVFPIFKAAKADFALKTMQTNLGQTIGDTGSILEVLRTLFGLVYCEISMLPTAPCFRVRLDDGYILSTADKPPSSAANADKEPLRVLNYCVKPQMFFGITPTCNLIFPSMAPSYACEESYITQPTRTYVNETLVTGMLPQHPFTSATLTVGWPLEIAAVLKDKVGSHKKGDVIKKVVNSGKNALVWPEEFFKGPVIGRMAIPGWFTLLGVAIKQNKEAAAANKTPLAPPAVNDDNIQKMHDLYDRYAEYEYYRTRYEKRGGAVDLAFNPYVVPGFPCTIFDQRETAFDTVGYVMSVTQAFSSGGGTGSMRTSINYSFSRTFGEMLDLLKQDLTRVSGTPGSAPAEPLEPVRNIVQNFAQAESMYNALFHGRAPMGDRMAAFDFRKVVGYVKPTDPHDTEPIVIDNTLDGKREIQPNKAHAALFSNYDAAMAYVARPITTLDEYLTFIHAPSGLSRADLIKSGQIVVDADPQRFAGPNNPDLVVYSRIRRFRPGPGTQPQPSVTGTEVTPAATAATVYKSKLVAFDKDGTAPQTRQNWDALLEEYRAEILAQAPRSW